MEMEFNPSPMSYSELISASSNVLVRCQSSSGGSSVILTRSASWGSSLPLPIGEAGSEGVHDGGMAAAASEEEQGKEEEILPAAPDPEAEQQQARDVTAHQDCSVVVAAAKVEEVLRKLQPFRANISQLLGPAGPHHFVTANAGRRCLAFMETEISFFASFLTTLKSNLRGDGDKRRHLQDFSREWWTSAEGLYERSLWNAYLVFSEIALENNVFLQIIYPSRNKVLRRAARWFSRVNSLKYSYCLIKDLYVKTEAPYRYPHLLLTSYDLGLTPQLAKAEAGALPLVGIDRPAKKILMWLTHQGKLDTSLIVMSMVGPVGIGKTTLAVELRNRLRRETSGGRCYFHCNVLVQATRGTDRNILLLQDILSQVSEPAATALSSDPSQAKTMEVLIRLVSECLKDKRYFIIIDDIHQESDWEEIKGAFPNTNNGSRILVTTRVATIAEACCSGSYCGLVHKMKPLSEIDSERLLLAKAVGSADGCLPNNLKPLCDEILRRCGGIPLFLTAIADWLKEQSSEVQQQHQQEDDEEHKKFAIQCKEQVPRLPERLEQALSSAFNDFPDLNLRSLSLYMSMFPYGYKFDKDRLISKWIQEGHLFWNGLHCFDLRQATRIAERFFSELVCRNVITCVASRCKHMEYEAEACQWQVNHFMQQFLVSKSAEMGFVFTTATLNLLAVASPATGHGNEPISRIPQRLALHHPDPLLPSLLESMDLFQTRSLAVSGAISAIPLEKFVNLVVLDLEGWENLKDEDLLQVCRSKMFFLSYLSIRNTRVSKLPHEVKELQSLRTLDVSYTQITELPHEIKELWILETLDISYTRIAELPQEIKELRFLRTLDISYTQISELPLELFELINLWHLDLRGTRISQLPKQIVGLRNGLHHLLVGGEGSTNSVETAMPQDIGCLCRLQTLATVDLTQHPASFIRVLGGLEWLTVLAVTWSFLQSTDRDYCEALLSSIRKWERLESLTIHCGPGCSMEFLGSLEKYQAPRELNKFKVTAGRFACIPRWLHGLEHLAFIQITVCTKQAADDLHILGALPKLQCLILGLDFIPGQPIVIENEGFSKLQRFSVDCLMPWLAFKAGAMLKLTYLQLKLHAFPESSTQIPSGISDLPSLMEVALCYKPWEMLSPNISKIVGAMREAIAEHPNQIDLFINGIQDYNVQAVNEVREISTGSPRRTDAGTRDDAQAVEWEATGVVQTSAEITEADS